MTKAFVFGKFLPFHKGHEAMILFALTQCDFLTVLICCSDKEMIFPEVRERWIKETFADQKTIEVKVFNYNEDELPNTSVASEVVSKSWADAFKKLLPDYSLLITSEPYGIFVAGFMSIRHVAFDREKKKFPISATLIREDRVAYWSFLPDSVKSYFVLKVVILGTESTGKTTLTKKLSEHFKCSSVSEAARDLIADSKECTRDDLMRVAEEHSQRIEKAIRGDSSLLLIDTDIHTTKSYSEFIFGEALNVSDTVYHSNRADLYIYLKNDVPYVQDGTRLTEQERNLLDDSHRNILHEHAISYTVIDGSWEERFEKAITLIHQLIEVKKKTPGNEREFLVN